jgi:transposase
MEGLARDKKKLYAFISLKYAENKSVRVATAELNATFGERTVSQTTVHNWYNKFKQGNFSLHHKKRENRPKKFSDDEVSFIYILIMYMF